MRIAACVLVALAAVACSGDDATPGPASAAPAPAGSVAATVPGPDSRFCEGVATIAASLDGASPPDDVPGFLAESYRELIAVAPFELVPDLEALVGALDGQSAADATAPSSPPADAASDQSPVTVVVVTPGERVAQYVAENCGRVDANPGPPATPPAGGFDTVPGA